MTGDAPSPATTEPVFDSPVEYVAEHVRRYVESGHGRPGVTDLLLVTRGRRSGKLRRTALVYAEDPADRGTRYVVTATNGGSDRHPAWFLNLTADPHVMVQIGTESFPATASSVRGDEKERLWRLLVRTMPAYESYRQRTGRDIPVIVLERR